VSGARIAAVGLRKSYRKYDNRARGLRLKYDGAYDSRMAVTEKAKRKKKSHLSGVSAPGAKLDRCTITVPRDLREAILERAGDRGFSAWAVDAFTERLQRQRILEWYEERRAARGGVDDPAAVAYAEEAWRNRKR
jgi:hypothetical protein